MLVSPPSKWTFAGGFSIPPRHTAVVWRGLSSAVLAAWKGRWSGHLVVKSTCEIYFIITKNVDCVNLCWLQFFFSVCELWTKGNRMRVFLLFFHQICWHDLAPRCFMWHSFCNFGASALWYQNYFYTSFESFDKKKKKKHNKHIRIRFWSRIYARYTSITGGICFASRCYVTLTFEKMQISNTLIMYSYPAWAQNVTFLLHFREFSLPISRNTRMWEKEGIS